MSDILEHETRKGRRKEEMKMQRLRYERSTFGFSEGFTPRRRFPITATESAPAAEEPTSPLP